MNDRFNFPLPFEDPVLIFALVMLIILLAPMIFKKLKIPGLVGLILAGTVVGPGLLGLIERDFTIELLGTVGLLYLMFMAGLSIDLNRFEKLRGKSLGFGTISFLIPQVAAVYVGTQVLDYSLSTSLLLGSIVGSHTLLAYPIAERLGITKNTGVTMSMGGILVPLANPETSDALMDIAFMVRDAKYDQPINPLTVSRDGADVEAQVAKGEKMLSHAVVHAAAADVPVNPDLSFITIYSNESDVDIQLNTKGNEDQLLTIDHIKIGLKHEDIEPLLADIIKDDNEFEKIAISRITRRLLDNSADYTPEAMPGVLVYDAHTSKVSEQLLFVGVIPEGIKVENTSSMTCMIMIFLSPKSTEVEQHLKGLNRVLKWIKADDVNKIKEAKSPKEVLQYLHKTRNREPIF